jgi:hypothetical protein
VELTEVHANGQDWWTLGFEATGPASLLRSTLQATAALVFAQALPGRVEPCGARKYNSVGDLRFSVAAWGGQAAMCTRG